MSSVDKSIPGAHLGQVGDCLERGYSEWVPAQDEASTESHRRRKESEHGGRWQANPEILFKGCVGLVAQKSWVMRTEPRAPWRNVGCTCQCRRFLAVPA